MEAHRRYWTSPTAKPRRLGAQPAGEQPLASRSRGSSRPDVVSIRSLNRCRYSCRRGRGEQRHVKRGTRDSNRWWSRSGGAGGVVGALPRDIAGAKVLYRTPRAESGHAAPHMHVARPGMPLYLLRFDGRDAAAEPSSSKRILSLLR